MLERVFCVLCFVSLMACAPDGSSSGDAAILQTGQSAGSIEVEIVEAPGRMQVWRSGSQGYQSAGMDCSTGQCIHTEPEVHVTMASPQREPQPASLENVHLRELRRAEMTETLARTVAEARSRCEDGVSTPTMYTVFLTEQPFDFGRLREARVGRTRDERIRETLLLRSERQTQLEPIYHEFARRTAAMGVEVVGERLSTSAVDVLVNPCRIEDIMHIEGVEAIEASSTLRTAQSGGAYGNGVHRRLALGLSPFKDLNINGGDGGNLGSASRVRIAVMEDNNSVNASHLSFRDTPTSGSRIVDTDRCTYWFPIIRCINSATTSSSSHGTEVTSVIASDLDDLQDPAFAGGGFWGIFERAQRSGIAPEAQIHYYSIDELEGYLAVAIEEAIWEDGADILNFSFAQANHSNFCQNNSFTGVREAVEAADGAGIPVVAATGNDGFGSGCTVSPYATFPDSIAVGLTEPMTVLADADTTTVQSMSGKGSFSAVLAGGYVVNSALVDVVTNGTIHLTASSGAGGYLSHTYHGTSYSTPAITGAIALLYDWIYDRGGLAGLESYSYTLRVLLAVLADGRSSHVAGGSRVNSLDFSFGFGVLRWVNLDTGIGNGGWGVRRFSNLQAGTVLEWPVGSAGPEASTVAGWKFVALINRNRFGGSPAVSYRLIDKCPSGGGEVVVRAAVRHPHKGRMRMLGSEMASMFHGRCLWVRATVDADDGPFSLYAADYFYTNSRGLHDSQ